MIKFYSIKLKWKNWLCLIAGFFSAAWILIRLIPKPHRTSYPCIRAAMPLATGFILYGTGLITSALAMWKASRSFKKANYLIGAILAIGSVSIILSMSGSMDRVQAGYKTAQHPANEPMGTGKGIFPGRVVWIHNPDATNEDCDPSAAGHGWFLDENNNQSVIDNMLSDGLKQLTGTSTDSEAWSNIFKYHNQTRNKELQDYQSHEVIFIKTNATSSWWGNINLSDFTKVHNSYYGISETSPHLVLSVLRQLVNIVGVPQQNIFIGDPMKHIYKHCYDLWHNEFPNIHYLDHSKNHLGRERVIKSGSAKIHYSDRGRILRSGSWEDATVGDPVKMDYLYTIFEQADYILNIPTLKGHKHAGITAFAKNHFGSHTREDAKHLHGGLVAIDDKNPHRMGYGLYRVQVDMMGHYLLGEKNLFYLMDGLWTSDYEIDEPDKWVMPPFNNDWMSSLFLSQDPVAIESVGFDFLRTEFTEVRGLASYPQMEGADDYLHQAADDMNWPSDISYDPEDDGSVLSSLGVHEHWNNPEDKQYSRNLGATEGIELISILSTNVEQDNALQVAKKYVLHQNYPNPFNHVTTIAYTLTSRSSASILIFDLQGRLVKEVNFDSKDAGVHHVKVDLMNMSSGVYFYKLVTNQAVLTKKMILMK